MLYEVLAPGYHSPLTKTQIAELFRVGRVTRNHRCKQISHKEWRTVDELFPLLKYQSATINCEESWQPVQHSAIDRSLVSTCAVAALVIAALWLYLAHDSNPTSSTYRDLVAPQRLQQEQRHQPQQQHWQTNGVAANAIVITPELPVVANTHPMDPNARQSEAQERQRQQVESARLQEERARQEQRARGQDVIIPLDQYRVVNVGGVGVSVKIHDNDVTSFDVWIGGQWRREVLKQKGITQSQTDETLIYNAGRARLYYVWEISGKVNHCRLRVRED
jgi:hypothetical protein